MISFGTASSLFPFDLENYLANDKRVARKDRQNRAETIQQHQRQKYPKDIRRRAENAGSPLKAPAHRRKEE